MANKESPKKRNKRRLEQLNQIYDDMLEVLEQNILNGNMAGSSAIPLALGKLREEIESLGGIKEEEPKSFVIKFDLPKSEE